jgi:hypothetical protein
MKATTALSAAIGLALAVAASSSAFAASTPDPNSRPKNVTAVPPPPPPPGGPDKYTTRSLPPGSGVPFARRPLPKPVDDIAGGPKPPPQQAGHGGNTCYPQQISSDGTTIPAAETECGKNLSSFCAGHNGGMVQNDDGTVTCSIP